MRPSRIGKGSSVVVFSRPIAVTATVTPEAPVPLTDPQLWETISAWRLPYRKERDDEAQPKRTCASFQHNLRKRGDWTDESARRITEMYRKFLYLKALTGKPVTPSEAIDMAWHLHLEFPADYRALCDAVGRDIPHRVVFYENELEEAYVRGRALYEAEFDAPPDRDLWPSREDQTRFQTGRVVAIQLVFGGFYLAVVLGVWVGGFRGFLLGAGIELAIVGVLAYLDPRLPPVEPSKIARCG
jgi:hypothetical protein